VAKLSKLPPLMRALINLFGSKGVKVEAVLVELLELPDPEPKLLII
jgi:hypothetical protein